MKFILCLLIVLRDGPAFAASLDSPAQGQPCVWPDRAFADVRPDHWAYQSVQTLTGMGVLKGYPDGSFQGDRTVTRFELALVLARFAEALQAALEPMEKPAGQQSSTASPESSPQDWLVRRGYIDPQSPLKQGPDKPATVELVSSCLASLGARVIELNTPSSEDLWIRAGELYPEP